MASSIMDLMKPDIRRRGDGHSEIRFTTRPEFTIPSGVVQGGIVAVMLDMAMIVSCDGGEGVVLARGTQTAVPI